MKKYKDTDIYDVSDYATGIVSSVADKINIMEETKKLQPLSINEFKTFFGD